ncbi:9082_t:CDS:1 [Funneliformis geosporum]|uniref:14776_t:CDS:1 n=1 Tax=Funneliformis geosporum TaxID=1117311 RepID=A0A9W4WX17_9GLOM|nr:9082_t:CDS:1 [Funneliformis geosporum]CAI2192046.1 14776_t:CDS:1 [Funneliformis geosporum]
MTRKRAIDSVINDKPQENPSFSRTTCKKRLKLHYYCNVCNSKFVNPHTKELHDMEDQNSSSESVTNCNINTIQENEFELESVIGSGSSTSASLYQFDQIQQNA